MGVRERRLLKKKKMYLGEDLVNLEKKTKKRN